MKYRTHTLTKVYPEVYMELQRIRRNAMGIEKPDEINPRRVQLLKNGWLRWCDTIFGTWLEIEPIALTETGKLRPNRNQKFVRVGSTWQRS